MSNDTKTGVETMALMALRALQRTARNSVEREWSSLAVDECLRAATPAPEPAAGGWYCADCQTGVRPEDVTFEEEHVACGRVITDDRAPEPACICGYPDPEQRSPLCALHGDIAEPPVDLFTRTPEEMAFSNYQCAEPAPAATDAEPVACVNCGEPAVGDHVCAAWPWCVPVSKPIEPPEAPVAAAAPVAFRYFYPHHSGGEVVSFTSEERNGSKPHRSEGLYTAAQLAAAEARGRASAEGRIAALREALLGACVCGDDVKCLGCIAITADDAAKKGAGE